jgi:uncharacterized protein
MPNRRFEIRDPVHTFIHLDEAERLILDSRPFQRLRHIHQLAMTYLVYPGASHKRFEHSLGVMELAGRVFDIVTRPDKLSDEVRGIVPDHGEPEFGYWRRTLKVAALCHDLGHLPFSHAAEEALLPKGWDHERLTLDLINSEELRGLLDTMRPEPKVDDLARLALGPKTVAKLELGLDFTPWHAILAEIIVGDAFGADRIDYLLRDSLHLGVAYGRFDHNRLVETLRILPTPTTPEDLQEAGGDVPEPALGVERGGLESAESLLMARYLMFSQVYFHPTRLIYDLHLKDFLSETLHEGHFSTDVEDHLSMTDVEVTETMRMAAADPGRPGHAPARRLLEREHFRVFYESRAEDVGALREVPHAVYEAAVEEFGADSVRYAASPRRGSPPDFPVRDRDGRSVSSLSLSEVIRLLPVKRDEYVFIAPELREDAKRWKAREFEGIVERVEEAQEKEEEPEKGGDRK